MRIYLPVRKRSIQVHVHVKRDILPQHQQHGTHACPNGPGNWLAFLGRLNGTLGNQKIKDSLGQASQQQLQLCSCSYITRTCWSLVLVGITPLLLYHGSDIGTNTMLNDLLATLTGSLYTFPEFKLCAELSRNAETEDCTCRYPQSSDKARQLGVNMQFRAHLVVFCRWRKIGEGLVLRRQQTAGWCWRCGPSKHKRNA